MIFGDIVDFPGIEFNGKWIPDTSTLEIDIEEAWSDYLLGDDRKPAAKIQQKREIKFRPSRQEDEDLNVSSHTIHSSDTEKLPTITLPDGSEKTIAEIIRFLTKTIPHQRSKRNGWPHFEFKGNEAIDALSIIYFDGESTKALLTFVKNLISHGILHNYTPHERDVTASILCVQPLVQLQCMNSFMLWPRHIGAKADPMDVMLHLSRLMDDICSKSPLNKKLWLEYEEQVCQLQVIGLPKEYNEKIAFEICLFNLMMRHAMILPNGRRPLWPSSLKEFPDFLSKTGYHVAGKWLTIDKVLLSLYGCSKRGLPSLAPKANAFKGLLACIGNQEDPDIHYEKGVISTDVRVLFATTWGTPSSPSVSTIYPNRLEEGLVSSVQKFCRENIICDRETKTVFLPPLLSFHRHDLGGDALSVLERLYQYMSTDQLRFIHELKDTCELKAVFDRSFDWTCGLPPKKHVLMKSPSAANLKAPPKPVPVLARENGSQAEISFTRESSFRDKARSWLFRQPSTGEAQLFEPSSRSNGESTTDPDSTNEEEYGSSPPRLDYAVSDLTFGSDFEMLLGSRSQRRLNV